MFSKKLWALLAAGSLLTAGLFWAVFPNQTTYQPGRAFPTMESSELLILTVAKNRANRLQELSCDDCSGPQSGLPPVEPMTAQETLDTAIDVASELAGRNWQDPRPVIAGIQGSSGGLALTLAAWSELTASSWPQTVAATGTVYRDGTVHAVQGTKAKSILAQENETSLLLLPAGNDVDDSYTGEVAYVSSVSEAIEALCAQPGAQCPNRAAS